METALVYTAPRKIGYQTYDEPALAPGEVRVSTLYSGISTGTELTAYRGTNPYMSKQWEAATRLFLPVPNEKASCSYPLAFGYEEVGRVVELGEAVEGVAVGDVVYGVWNHKTSCVMSGEQARAHKFPADLDPILGIFMGIAPTALNAILDASIHVGETVVVFGEGTVGQIITQLAKLNGGTVIAVDLMPMRLDLAKKLGADMALNVQETSVAETVKQLTNGRGADFCIEARGITGALHEAIRAVAYSGQVLAGGFYQGAADDLFLGEEFHHNRINIVGSQIYGVNPGLTYRWNKPRLEATVIELLVKGQLNLRDLVTHVVPFEQGAEAFEIADRRPESAVQVVLQFQQ